MNIKQTRELARKLAHEMPARVYALVGELGSGKTTFTQAFLRELGIRGRITSPTFVLMKKYEPRHPELPPATARHERAGVSGSIYHIDAYRIDKPKELLGLGFKKIIDDSNNIVLIEWADRIKQLIPKNAVWIKFKHGKTVSERTIEIKE